MARQNFCGLHGNTDVPCLECKLLTEERIARLTRERDEARAAYDQLREDQQRERDEMDQLAMLCGAFEDQLDNARADLVGHMQQWNATYLALQAVEAECDRLRALLREADEALRRVSGWTLVIETRSEADETAVRVWRQRLAAALEGHDG